MRWTKTHLFTLKEAPSDAEIVSHQLLVRGGFIKKVAPGIYTYGNLALRAIRKFEAIVREELDRRGCTEILMPMVQPRELWEETGRWSKMGDGLLKFQNRNGHWHCLGATHEEAVTDYVRSDVKSYRDLPKTIYQIQIKYRDEIRPRFGLMRGREFIMKDAYSFDLDAESALKTYQLMYEAYQAIFDRLGLIYRIVQADAGPIGGSQTHEFQLLAEAGEDALLVSDSSDFAANVEICPAIDAEPQRAGGATPVGATPVGAFSVGGEGATGLSPDENLQPLSPFATPGLKTIADLAKATGLPERELVKTLFFSANEGLDPKDKSLQPIAVLLRGSDEVNLVKLKNLLQLANPPRMLTEEEVRQTAGAGPGSCGPVGLKIPIYMDTGVQGLKNYIVGANQEGFHLRHVNHERDYKPTQIVDLRVAREGDRDPQGPGRLRACRGIEVGHVFYLGTTYSQKMNACYLDREGKARPLEMGCYGIGVSRTVQAAIEQSHDQDGIIWPVALAPFEVHLCALDMGDPGVKSLTEKLEQELEARGVGVLVDDRDERPGVKFKDADLLGFPVRLNIGRKGLEAGVIEVIVRRGRQVRKVKPDEVIPVTEKLLRDLKQSETRSETRRGGGRETL
ncbi:MAG: proline--tRNA ligase [Bdellovibrio sp.]|nr:MAG: proline--tRNA ligase [Bdellovibrio sp.]